MKAITIRHPWAHSIVHLGKPIENRSWSTAYRGPLLIHAASTMTAAEFGDFAEFYCADIKRGPMPSPQELRSTLGHIIGVVDLVDVVEEHPSPWFFGPYGLVLANPRPLARPVKWKGQLNLYNVPDEAVIGLAPLLVPA